MENLTETIKTFLEENRYKVVEVDEDGIVTVRHQMSLYHICPNANNKNFVSIMLPNLDEIDDDNPLPVVLRCMQIVSQQMVVKAYPLGKENVAACYEFFFNGEDDLKFQIEKGFESLVAAKMKYRRLKDGADD